MDVDHLTYLRGMNTYIEATQKPFPVGLRASEACRADAKQIAPWRFFSRCMLPYLGQAHVAEACGIARLRNALTAIGIESYRLANGRLPERLNEIAPDFLLTIPVDPFTGRPLSYRKLAKGYVVYSVGEDGKDDGGDDKRDITFTVER